VRVARDGTVRTGIIEDDLARTLVSGRFALSIRPGGAGRETTNFGFDWRSFSLPARLDTGARAERSGERGCSALGCVHGEWMRLGWGRVSTPLRQPPTPEGAVFTSTGGGWWLLRCALTGRTLDAPRRDPRLVLRQVPRVAGWRGVAPTGLSAAVIESTPWTPFVGAAPPTRAPEDVTLQHVLDVPESPLAVYAAGPRDGVWSNRGKWVVRVADPYELESPVWSTAVSPTPWADLVPAALAFGHNIYGPPNPTLSVAIDPEGNGGVLFMHVPTTGTEAYLLQANQVLRRIDDDGAGLTSATSFVELGDRSFIGVDGDVFRIFEVQGGRAKEFGRYPKRVGDAGKAALRVQVVRSARGTRLGLWIRASKLRGSRTSYFVHEVDPTTGALSSPLVVTPAALGKLPPACGADADGWLLEGPPPVSPYIEQPSDLPSPPRDIRARLIVNPNGICTTGLFAETDIAIPTRTRQAGAWNSSQSEPGPLLTLSDRSDPGRRWELRCRP
jgi:hypothetical protein